jgi:phosphodiesterase/alkaline phosphatase D-like protein
MTAIAEARIQDAFSGASATSGYTQSYVHAYAVAANSDPEMPVFCHAQVYVYDTGDVQSAYVWGACNEMFWAEYDYRIED